MKYPGATKTYTDKLQKYCYIVTDCSYATRDDVTAV